MKMTYTWFNVDDLNSIDQIEANELIDEIMIYVAAGANDIW